VTGSIVFGRRLRLVLVPRPPAAGLFHVRELRCKTGMAIGPIVGIRSLFARYRLASQVPAMGVADRRGQDEDQDKEIDTSRKHRLSH